MQTKLTLRLEKEIIEEIKIYALKHKKSLSTLTETLYKSTLNTEEEETLDITPIVKKYKGILQGKVIDENEARMRYLKEKHMHE
jgi:hypothetical protein